MIHTLNEKRDQLTPLKQVQPILESGLVVSAMAMANNSGPTVPDMKENGKTIERMEKVNSPILTGTFTRVTG